VTEVTQQDAAGLTGLPIPFGRYQILELIAVGGMAEVYKASESGPGGFHRVLVIKRVKSKYASDRGFIQMFVDEAKLLASLSHPNIVSVFEFGEVDGHYYLAMEYLDGLHLQAVHVRHVQKKKSPLPWAASLLIARDVLRGLEYAHSLTDASGQSLGLVHRDINLVNIMMRRDGTPKILDFGIAKAKAGIRGAETAAGVLKGKFGYMSPEQAEGRPLDRRSDVFSAAIVLHELLTGRRLFWGNDNLAILRAVRSGPIGDPRRYNPSVPEDVVRVTLKGLSRELATRFGSAGEMADALDELAYVHRAKAALLRDVMADVLGSEAQEAELAAASAERKMTLMAWQRGAPEPATEGTVPATPAAMVAGSVGAPVAAAAGAVGAIAAESLALEDATVITTEPRWMLPTGALPAGAAPPDAGQALDQAVRSSSAGLPLPEQETRITSGSLQAAPLAGQETQILGDAPLPDLETQLLREVASSHALAAAGQETQILAEDAPAPVAPPAPPEAAPSVRQDPDVTQPALRPAAPRIPAARRRFPALLVLGAVAAGGVAAFLVFWFLLR
jgi:tRNA A-37 threonylcarbamoyl transferase component Bud32